MLLGRYRIERTLGRGGMGEVLLAHDDLLNRPVALKRLDPQGADRESRRRGILKEARRVSAITDRRIASIYDVVDLEDEVMLVMEYVNGITLRQRMADPVSLDEFWSLATQCVEGLLAAHAHGVIHRDIKPENLMLTAGGQLKVLDFGIARRIAVEGENATMPGSDSHSYRIAGTPHYMAPEAHMGGVVDERTDIFSLGVVFYELLTARRPFEGSNYAVVVNQILNSTPPPVAERNPAAGAELSGLIEDMLAKKLDERIATAGEVMERLAAAREGGAGGVSGPRSEGSPGVPLVATPARVAAAAAMPREIPAGVTPTSANTIDSTATRSRRWSGRLARVVLGAGALAAAVAAVVWRTSAAPPLPRDINLAVLAPLTPGASEDFANFARGAVELTNSRLQRHGDTPGFQMASFAEGSEEKIGSAADARKILGTNLALIPTLDQGPDMLRARLELRDPEGERVLVSRTIEVPSAQPFEFLDRLYRESAAMLGQVPRVGAADSLSGIRGAGTLRFYLQGMGRLRAAADSAEALRALAEFEAACRTEPEAAVTEAGVSAAAFKLHQLTANAVWLVRADESSRRAVARDGTRAEAHRSRAAVLASQRKMDESLAEYAHAARLDPGRRDLILNVARAHARAGDRATEKEIYLEAIRLRPHSWQPWWWLAIWHHRAGNIDESIHANEELIRRAPHYYRGYANLGGLMVLHGDYVAAITALRHSIKLHPTRTAFGNLGTAYFNSGRLAESVDAYNQSFQFGHAEYSTWLNLGDAYYWLRGEKAQAAEAYAQAIRLGREEAASRMRSGSSVDLELAANLATVFPKLGHPDSARVHIASALALDSANTTVQYCAALTHWQLAERARALDWLERAVRGGYPVVWLRDSPIFREWREVDRFRVLVGDTLTKHAQAAASSRGG
ncbi:MAG: protein kinase [Candidatus Eisenbacteria bacterium]